MKYCLKYDPARISKYLELVDEIKINFNDISEYENCQEIIQSHLDKTFIIEFDGFLNEEEDDFYLVSALNKKFKNIKFSILRYDYDTIEFFTKEKIPFFFQATVTDFEELHTCCLLNVTDVIIGGDLGFNLEKVKNVVNSYDNSINIRVFPNICNTNTFIDFTKVKTLYSFFIRPEDTDVYKEFIDVYDLTYQSEVQDTYYKIYAIDKKWYGDLKEMILNLNENIDSRCLFPMFAFKRLNCDRKCLKGGTCDCCDRIFPLIDAMQENDMLFKVDN